MAPIGPYTQIVHEGPDGKKDIASLHPEPLQWTLLRGQRHAASPQSTIQLPCQVRPDAGCACRATWASCCADRLVGGTGSPRAFPSPSCSRMAPRRRQAIAAPTERRRSNSLPTSSGPPSTMLPQAKASTAFPPSASCASAAASPVSAGQLSAAARSCRPRFSMLRSDWCLIVMQHNGVFFLCDYDANILRP